MIAPTGNTSISSFQLIDLSSNISFTFQFFPMEIRTSDRANWQPQETTIGVKPLFYGNREPQGLSVSDLYLDKTETDTSLTPDLGDLRALMDEVEGQGMPPALLAVWGDQKLRCVLEDLSIEQVMFNAEGEPTRARISIEVKELQGEGEATSVTVRDSTYNEDVEPG